MAQDLNVTPLPSTIDEFEDRFIKHSVVAFIRPDMASNIYSLVDFWLATLCAFYKRTRSLPGSPKRKKGQSQLHAYHKYFVQVASIDLNAVASSFKHLDSLRQVRNYLIHCGAQVDGDNLRAIADIDGVSVSSGLIVLADEFIWNSLDHARTYLCAVARA